MSLILAVTSAAAPSLPGANLTERRQITDNSGSHRDNFNGTIAVDARSIRVRLNVRSIAKKVRVSFGAPQNTYNIGKAALEINGALYPLIFSGSRAVTVPFQGHVTSDDVDLTVYPSDVVWLRYSPNGNVPNSAWAASGVVNEPAVGNLVDTPTWVNNGFGLYPVLPSELTGLVDPDSCAVLLLGDSITEGGNDNQGGWAQRALRTRGIAYVNAGTWAQATAAIISGGAFTPTGLAQMGPSVLTPYTHVVCAYGTNDINAGLTLAQLQTQFTSLWTLLAASGLTIAQRTVPPRTTGSWTTLAGQTVMATESVRQALNAWIRTNPNGVTCIDSAATVEDASTGKWRVDQGALTTDGTHPEPAGHVLMAAPLNTWLAGITA